MATRDPVILLTRFVDRLKREPVKDGRTSRKAHAAAAASRSGRSGEAGWCFDPGQNWLVRQWQALEILELSRGAGRVIDSIRFAPCWVDETTAIVAAGLGKHDACLVWRQDADYVCRCLSDSEGADFC